MSVRLNFGSTETHIQPHTWQWTRYVPPNFSPYLANCPKNKTCETQ